MSIACEVVYCLSSKDARRVARNMRGNPHYFGCRVRVRGKRIYVYE